MRAWSCDLLARVVTWFAHAPAKISRWWDRTRATYVSEEWRAQRRRLKEDL